jgi:adenylate kinase family enzyme
VHREEDGIWRTSIAAMDRIVVVGTTGSGKTTVGSRIADILGLRFIELDSLYWGPDWVPREQTEFERSVVQAISSERWLVDGNYSRVREIVWPRATHIIWLNYSFSRVMCQLTRRTLSRVFHAQELFSGNRETLSNTLFSRESILLWAIRTFQKRRRDYGQLMRSGKYGYLEFIELRNPAETEEFLKALERAYGTHS